MENVLVVAIIISLFGVLIAVFSAWINFYNVRNNISLLQLKIKISLDYNDKKIKGTSITDLKSGKDLAFNAPLTVIKARSGSILSLYNINFAEDDNVWVKDISSMLGNKPIYRERHSESRILSNVYVKKYGDNSFGTFYLISGTGDKNYLVMLIGKEDSYYLMNEITSTSTSKLLIDLEKQREDYKKMEDYLVGQNIVLG